MPCVSRQRHVRLRLRLLGLQWQWRSRTEAARRKYQMKPDFTNSAKRELVAVTPATPFELNSRFIGDDFHNARKNSGAKLVKLLSEEARSRPTQRSKGLPQPRKPSGGTGWITCPLCGYRFLVVLQTATAFGRTGLSFKSTMDRGVFSNMRTCDFTSY
jgi:hypothetical protein